MADGDCVAPERQGSCPSTVAIASPFDISSFTHTPCYCEENVYLLTKKLCKDGVADPMGADLFVLFISNEEKMIVEVSSTCTNHLLASTYEGIFNSRWKLPCTVSYQSSKVPLWHQKASKRNDGLVLWDYHVICIQKERGKELDFVWDLDSDLPFPSPLTTYLSEATRPIFHPVFVNSRLFRVVHAPIFHRCFASDRSHMKDDLGNWLALPPSYEPITAEDGTVNNLSKYMEMREADVLPTMQDSIQGVFSNEYGVVLAEAMLEWFFSQI